MNRWQKRTKTCTVIDDINVRNAVKASAKWNTTFLWASVPLLVRRAANKLYRRTTPFFFFPFPLKRRETERSMEGIQGWNDERVLRRREKSGYLQWRSRSSYEKTGNSNRPIAAMNMDAGSAQEKHDGEIFVMQIFATVLVFINIEDVFSTGSAVALWKAEGEKNKRVRSFYFPFDPELILDIKRTNFQFYFCLFARQTDRSGTINRHQKAFMYRRDTYRSAALRHFSFGSCDKSC